MAGLSDVIPTFLRAVGNDASVRHLAVRRRILAAAKHRFARFSYDGTSLADIAHAADISSTELLLHFEDKIGILIAVFDEGWASLNPRMQDIITSSVSARDAALSMFAVMVNILERDEDLARLLLFEGRRPHPESGETLLSEGYRGFMRLCTELVRRGQKDGSFGTAHDPRIIASVLIGAMENLMRDRLIAEQESGFTPFAGAELVLIFDALVTRLGQPEDRTRPAA